MLRARNWAADRSGSAVLANSRPDRPVNGDYAHPGGLRRRARAVVGGFPALTGGGRSRIPDSPAHCVAGLVTRLPRPLAADRMAAGLVPALITSALGSFHR